MKKINQGVALWNKAKKIIPGGSQLLSKRSEMFLPEQWPSYYKKAKGVEVTDLDGNKFIDMSLMGVGPYVLGYGDKDVNQAVKKIIMQAAQETFISSTYWSEGIGPAAALATIKKMTEKKSESILI